MWQSNLCINASPMHSDVSSIAVYARSTRTATGARMPYGVSHSYLLPGRGSVSRSVTVGDAASAN